MIVRLSVVAFVLLAAAAEPALAQDAAAGAKVWNKCRACHQVGEGAKNIVGPRLNGILGRKAGSIEDYNYSDANKKSGIVWDEPMFVEYIKNPKAKIPGTKMEFPGLKTEQEIKDLTAYLRQFSPDGKKMD